GGPAACAVGAGDRVGCPGAHTRAANGRRAADEHVEFAIRPFGCAQGRRRRESIHHGVEAADERSRRPRPDLPHQALPFFAYFFWKRSMRPAESTNFCLPVKNGWHFEQISTRSSFLVEPVVQLSPHAQCT